jgi:hypothetical protein
MDIILTLGTLAFCVAMGVLALQLPQLAADPGGPAIFPLAMAVMTGGACLILLWQRWRAARSERAASEPMANALLASAREHTRPLGVIVLVLAFPFAIEWIGFTPAVLLFTFLIMLVSGKSLLATTVASVLMTVGVYVAYVVVLGAVLPRGELVARLLG